MKTLEQFLSDYIGKSKGYPEGSYVGECLSICKIYIEECFGINPPASGSGSAYGYWSNFPNPLGEVFEKVLNTPDLIPQKGWIGIMEPWDSNPYGHIFIVADGSTKSICKNWAQNWTSKIFQLESNKYTHIIGFLKPKSSIIEDMDIVTQLIKDNGLTEGDIRWLIDLKKNNTVSNLEKSIKTLEKQLDITSARIDELEQKLSENDKTIADWQKQCETANKRLQTLSNDLETMTSDRDNWRKLYNNKNDAYNELLSNTVSVSWFTVLINKIKSLFNK